MTRTEKDLHTAMMRIVELEKQLGAEKLTLIENQRRMQLRIREMSTGRELTPSETYDREHEVLRKENLALRTELEMYKKEIRTTELPWFMRYEERIATKEEENEQLRYQLDVCLRMLRYVDKSSLPRFE